MSNRTVIVTGSSSGIGLDVARGFLEQGANVVLNGRDPEKLAKVAASLGPAEQIASVAGSIADAATRDALVTTAVERFGGVDVLVNNAGTFGAMPFVDVTEDYLDGFIDGNLKGTYFTAQAVVRHMIDQARGGSIINIGTVFVEHAVTGVPATAPLVTKGAVHALTVNLAAELAPFHIRVNTVAPGVIRTPLFPEADQHGHFALANRVGEVSETTAAVLYLADASFTTGHVLRVDGGFVTGRA